MPEPGRIRLQWQRYQNENLLLTAKAAGAVRKKSFCLNFLFAQTAALKNYLISPVLTVAGMERKSKDPRHQRRQKIVKSLFASAFDASAKRKAPVPSATGVKDILRQQKKIDRLIVKAAPRWPLERINKIDLAILRLAIWELCFQKKEPPKVIIDEAVELAKEFGGESSPGFINGVLGTIYEWQ